MRQTKLPASLEFCRMLNISQMAQGLGYSVVHVRRLYRTGKIPKPVAIGGGKLGWPASTLIALTGGQPTPPNKVV